MTITDCRKRYKVETKIHPRPASNYTVAASTTEQESTTLLDNETFTHRVDSWQPIEYSIGGLKYEEPLRERDSNTARKTWNTFKLYKDQCLT